MGRSFAAIAVAAGIISMAAHSPAIGQGTRDGETVLTEYTKELYWIMRRDNVITEEEYQHALKYGRLSGDGTVKKSPLPKRRQRTWNELFNKRVVTAEELVQVLGKGKLGNLSAAEMEAFEELAPVYEPDPVKRVSYPLRKKHIIVELIRLEHSRYKATASDLDAAIEHCGLPVSDKLRKRAVLLEQGSDAVPVFLTSHNYQSAQDVEADHVWAPYDSWQFSLSGAGVKVAMRDLNLSITNHPEFGQQRVVQKDIDSTDEHATSVCGTICAAGVVSNAHGIAHAARVDSYSTTDSMPFSDLLQSEPEIHVAAYVYGVLAGWGVAGGTTYWMDVPVGTNGSPDESGTFGRYENDSQDIDRSAYTAAYILPIVSAGNDRGEYHGGTTHWCAYHGCYTNDYHPTDGSVDNGYDTLNPLACAKNALVVGALPTGSEGITPSSYSSCGPTDDGRIKPDVIAPGGPAYTTSDSTNQYTMAEGTSVSAAVVTGILALLQEEYERIYGTQCPLLGATWAALLRHTATRSFVEGPDYLTGWGIVNAFEAAKVISNNVTYASLPHIKEFRLLDGEAIEFEVPCESNAWFRTSIGYFDPPATVGASSTWSLDDTNSVLCNDLDLRVYGPDGSTNMPWVLDPGQPSASATEGDNRRDNYEQVAISVPSNAVYRVCISHKGTLTNGYQDVGVIMTGNTPAEAPEFRITEAGVTNAQGDVVELKWPGVLGGRYEVEVSTNLNAHPDGWSQVGNAIIANSTNLVWTNTFPDVRHQFYRARRRR